MRTMRCIAYNMNDLQQLLKEIGKHSKDMGLNINTDKTKLLIITREPDTFKNTTLKFGHAIIERLNKFKYLGTWLCEDWTLEMEIKCRIEMARGAFTKLRKVLTNTDFDLSLKTRFIKCYVWSVLLYGMEGWTLKVFAMNKIEAFEMWIYRDVDSCEYRGRQNNQRGSSETS